MTLSDYISKYRSEHGLSQRKFAEQCGLSNGYISMLEKGLNPNTNKPIVPSLLQLQKLADGMNTPLMQLFEDVEDIPVDLSLIPTDELPPNCLPLPKMRKWPVLGAAACGEPVHRESENEIIYAPDDIDADYVFRCVGDSMNGAHIFDGDLVFIKQGTEVPDGAIGLVRVEDEYMLKRIYHRPDCLELRSDNPAYPPRYITGEQVNAEIVGRAVKFITVAI